jgi:hypothetical membrane protein
MVAEPMAVLEDMAEALRQVVALAAVASVAALGAEALEVEVPQEVGNHIMKFKEHTVGILGIASVVNLILAILIFGVLNSNFSFLNDFISKLGAKGEPNALLFNLFGFVSVGILTSVFGFAYGRLQKDKLLSILLSLFGIGFAFTAVPVDFQVESSGYSKAHIVAICLGLAFWLFGLSRMGYNKKLNKKVRIRANIAAVLLTISIIGAAIELWSMPVTHRFVFGVVFGWILLTSIELISLKRV